VCQKRQQPVEGEQTLTRSRGELALAPDRPDVDVEAARARTLAAPGAEDGLRQLVDLALDALDTVRLAVSASRRFAEPGSTLLAPGYIIAGHCTGWRALHALANAYGERVSQSAVGTRYRFDAETPPIQRIVPPQASFAPKPAW